MKHTVRIPAELFESSLDEIKSGDWRLGEQGVGEVHLPGDWNNWGNSPNHQHRIRPKSETRMELKDGYYELEIDVEPGLHECKPAIVASPPAWAGCVDTIWIDHPKAGVTGFTLGKPPYNWAFTVG